MTCPTCGGRKRVQVGPAPTVNYGHGYGLDCPDCRECPVQLAAYVDAVPYDTETDERGEW